MNLQGLFWTLQTIIVIAVIAGILMLYPMAGGWSFTLLFILCGLGAYKDHK